MKQWCGCWGSQIYPLYSALQQLHRHKERHHYSEARPVNRPPTWGACRLCTGLTRGEREVRGYGGGQDVGGVFETGGAGQEGREQEWKWVCVQYRVYFYLSWMKEHEWIWGCLPISSAKMALTQQTFRRWIDEATLKTCAGTGSKTHPTLFLHPFLGFTSDSQISKDHMMILRGCELINGRGDVLLQFCFRTFLRFLLLWKVLDDLNSLGLEYFSKWNHMKHVSGGTANNS